MCSQVSRDLDPKLKGAWGLSSLTSCLTNRKTEAQDGLKSDLRFHRDSLSLLPLQHHHDGGLPSPAHLTT